MEEILEIDDDGTQVVIDNGSTTFVPLLAYMVENDVVPMLVEAGHKVLIHVVLVGGQGLKDTANNFAAVTRHFPGTPVVLWMNPWFGNLTANGKAFEESDIVTSNADSIHGTVALPLLKRETFGKDIEVMLRQRKTFAEVAGDPEYPVMARQRLQVFKSRIFNVISEAQL